MLPKKTTKTDIENSLEFRCTYRKFKNIVLNLFEWEGLDELNIKEEWIERVLCEKGYGMFFKDERYGLMFLEATPIGRTNVYRYNTQFRPYGNGETFPVYNVGENCVIIQNNKLWSPTEDIIFLYTNRLYKIQRTTDVNVDSLKFPFVIVCDDKNLLSFKKLFEDVEGYEPAVYADKGLNVSEAIKVLETGAKPYMKELMDYKKQVECEFLTALGINNSNTEKRERLITDEVNSNNQFIEFNIDVLLEQREKACEAINAMFGTNISVRKRKKEVEYDVMGMESMATDEDKEK